MKFINYLITLAATCLFMTMAGCEKTGQDEKESMVFLDLQEEDPGTPGGGPITAWAYEVSFFYQGSSGASACSVTDLDPGYSVESLNSNVSHELCAIPPGDPRDYSYVWTLRKDDGENLAESTESCFVYQTTEFFDSEEDWLEIRVVITSQSSGRAYFFGYLQVKSSAQQPE